MIIKKKAPAPYPPVSMQSAEVAEKEIPDTKVKASLKEVPAGPSSKHSPQVSTTAGHGFVSKEYAEGSVEVEEAFQFPPVKEVGNLALVNVTIGVTRNLGNFESVRVTVGVILPCQPTPEEIDATYESAKGWVDARLEVLNQEITATLV